MKKNLFLVSAFIIATIEFATAQAISPPYYNNFEGSITGWTAVTLSGSAWQYGQPAQAPINTAHSGSNVWGIGLNGPYLGSSTSYLITPVFDFTTAIDPLMRFWQSRDIENGWDGVRIDYSTDSGLTWQILNPAFTVNWYNGTVNSSNQPAWSGDTDAWIKSTAGLSMLTGMPSVQFRFVFTSDAMVNKPGFIFDDFEIFSRQLHDAGVSDVLSPAPVTLADTNTALKVIVTNFGLDTLTVFDINYTLNGSAPVVYNWTGILLPGVHDTVVLDTVYLSQGIYNICTYTVLTNDSYLYNDTLYTTSEAKYRDITLSVNDSLGGVSCINPPVTDAFQVTAQTILFNNGDSITILFSFGDGSDTTFSEVINNNHASFNIHHDYIFSGLFSIQLIASSPNGSSDTLTVVNQLLIGDTCGTIGGKVYVDINNNCIYDSSDIELNHIPLLLMQNGVYQKVSHTDASGKYYFIVSDSLMYDVFIDTTYLWADTYCPVNGVISGIVEPSYGNDFAIFPKAGFDLEPYMQAPNLSLAPNAQLDLYLTNNFFTPVNGILSLVIDTNLVHISSSIPPVSQINGDTLTWNTGILGFKNIFPVKLFVIADSILQLGDSVCYTIIGMPVINDSVPSNNIKHICGEVILSIDPNNKTVYPSGTISPQTDLLTYTINFQNTGTAPAYNVFILDTIVNELDVSTLQIIYSTHPMTVTMIAPRVIKFSFNNIILPDSGINEPGSHGFVIYTIALNPGLAHNSQISNTGYIYFDFNPAVVTNTTVNIIGSTTDISNPSNPDNFDLYPNPAGDYINIIIKDHISSQLHITDISGNKILILYPQGQIEKLDISNLAAGIYFINLVSSQHSNVKKFIKLK